MFFENVMQKKPGEGRNPPPPLPHPQVLIGLIILFT